MRADSSHVPEFEEPDDLVPQRTRYLPLAVSLVFHVCIAVALWSVVFVTVRTQSISLIARTERPVIEPDISLPKEDVSEQPVEDAAERDDDSGSQSTLDFESLFAELAESQSEDESTATSPQVPVGESPSVEFFGIRAEGERFIFVLDISYSMKARNGARFQRACNELYRSLSGLDENQSYSVFLFSWTTEMMFHDRTPRFSPPTDANLLRLRSWIDNIELSRGTDPRRALGIAHTMQPDAVFLLSDGQFNQHSIPWPNNSWVDSQGQKFQASVLEGVSTVYRNTPIHAIALENPFALRDMEKIAEASGGACRYVPTSSLQPTDDRRFLRAVQRIRNRMQKSKSRRPEYQARLSAARDLIEAGELAFAEFLTRPLHNAEPDEILNPGLWSKIQTVFEDELGTERLEDLRPQIAQSESLRILNREPIRRTLEAVNVPGAITAKPQP